MCLVDFIAYSNWFSQPIVASCAIIESTPSCHFLLHMDKLGQQPFKADCFRARNGVLSSAALAGGRRAVHKAPLGGPSLSAVCAERVGLPFASLSSLIV